MANQYLALFNQQIEQNASFIDVMIDIVEQYSTHYWSVLVNKKENQVTPVKDHVCLALEKFYDYLFTFVEQRKPLEKVIGKVIISYPFEQNIPADFLEVLEAAKKEEIALLIKLSKERAPSKLVADCENTAAGEGFSAEAIFAQTAILEEALRHKKITQQSHIEEAEAKVEEWNHLLYSKFSEMILDSNSLNDLKSAVKKNFNKNLILSGSKLEIFKLNIKSQLKFLEKIKFFNFYYQEKNLADKYDFTFEAYQEIKQNHSMTPELKMTLSGLFFGTINKAYKPLNAKKFELMALSDGTVNNVFPGVRTWAEKNYASFQGKDLYNELLGQLKKEEDTYKVWEEVSHRIHDTQEKYRTYQPLMQNLYTMKYAGDPNQDPRDLLVQLPKPHQLPRSPVKSNKTSSVTSCTEIAINALVCTEEEIAQLEKDSASKILQRL